MDDCEKILLLGSMTGVILIHSLYLLRKRYVKTRKIIIHMKLEIHTRRSLNISKGKIENRVFYLVLYLICD